jgi:hypothetical protein
MVKKGMDPSEYASLSAESQQKLAFLIKPKIMVVAIGSPGTASEATFEHCEMEGFYLAR